MSDDTDRTGNGGMPLGSSSDGPGGAGAKAAWPIAFFVVLVLLVAALVYIALTRGGQETGTTPSVTTTATSAPATSVPATTGTTRPAPTSSASAPTTTRAATTTAPTTVSTSTASTAAASPAPCTAAALLAAVPQDVKAEGSSVQTFACTPSAGAGVADGFAWARLGAPNVDPLIVFYNVVPDVQPGQPTIASWQVISYGSAIVCEDSMPVEACNLLPGVPRR